MRDHELIFPGCVGFCPIDENLIPTGEIVKFQDKHTASAWAAFDFASWQHLGKKFQDAELEMKNNADGNPSLGATQVTSGFGYNHHFVAERSPNTDVPELQLLASIRSTSSRVQMDVLTTEAGVQFYTGNYLDHPGKLRLKDGKQLHYGRHAGFCMETQNFPDCVNQYVEDGSAFEGLCRNPIYRVDECYESETIYRFSIF